MIDNKKYNIPTITYCIKCDFSRNEKSFIYEIPKFIIDNYENLKKISTLQRDIGEIYCRKERMIELRLRGEFPGYHIVFFDDYEKVKDIQSIIKVVFSKNSTDINLIDKNTIFVCDDITVDFSRGFINKEIMNQKTMKEILTHKIKSLSPSYIDVASYVENCVGLEIIYTDIKSSLIYKSNFYTYPIENIMTSMRVSFETEETPDNFNEEDIEKYINSINEIRSKVVKNADCGDVCVPIEYYFVDMSGNFKFILEKRLYSKHSLNKNGDIDPENRFLQIKNFNNGIISPNLENNILLRELESERGILDSLISICAANTIAPVIKIPASNKDFFPTIRMLAEQDREDYNKIQKIMLSLKEIFSEKFGNILDYISKSRNSRLQFISNIPYEWASQDGLPLMVRHDVSRIPIFPTDISCKLLSNNNPILLKTKDLKNILIIRSFADDDSIKNHLSDKIQKCINVGKLYDKKDTENLFGIIGEDTEEKIISERLDVNVKIIDVDGKDNFIKAINENNFFITVFDMHGGHDENKGGFLLLKNGPVYINDIVNDIKVSPIIILSACDTSPVDKGSDSVSDGFFRSGAITLISSALPIQSGLSSTFVVRLLERIRTLLPIEVETRRIRWSTFVSGMIRRTYYLELANRLQTELKFSNDVKHKILLETGTLIDPIADNWHKSCFDVILKHTGKDYDWLEKFIEREFQFFECLKYFQLGRPDLIILQK
ncbi:hypothetical protein ABHV46_05365 [Asaia sp. BMEF1]|uniref:hypothetical protein n=1 Tax=Asaia sp. BMEF1 TaxID=3155932 RepID=UPI003F664E9F